MQKAFSQKYSIWPWPGKDTWYCLATYIQETQRNRNIYIFQIVKSSNGPFFFKCLLCWICLSQRMFFCFVLLLVVYRENLDHVYAKEVPAGLHVSPSREVMARAPVYRHTDRLFGRAYGH